MVDLAQWLTAQLDEDERIARAATAGPWWADSSIHTEAIYGSGNTAVVAGGRWGGEASVFESDADAAHIAEHDPARVLREIDAKRELIREVFVYEAKIDGEWGCCHDADEIAAGQCPETQPKDITALRLLAAPYSDRPGFREEWAP